MNDFLQRLFQLDYAVNPAIDAFRKLDSNASKDFHNQIWDEPHKSNLAKHDRLKYLELAADRATISILLVGAIVAIFEAISPNISIPQEKLIGVSLLFQFSFLVASAFVLGYIEYVQKKEYRALYDNEKRREVWECDNYIEGEITEMIELYHRRGLSKEDAETVVKILSSNVQFFVEIMMKEELLLFPLSHEPLLAVVTASTFVAGIVPMIPTLLVKFIGFSMISSLQFTLFIMVVSLFLCGSIKGLFTISKWYTAGIERALIGLSLYSFAFYFANALTGFLI